MKKDNFKITMPELQKLIKEEYANMAKDASRAKEIEARLEAINEELETLPETLSEVEASGTKKLNLQVGLAKAETLSTVKNSKRLVLT